jgi:hypothetical protein
MNYELSVKERLLLTDILPIRGSASTLTTSRDILDMIQLDRDERSRINFKMTQEGQVTWDESKTTVNSYSFHGPELELILKVLRELDKAEKLTFDMLPVYKKFMIAEDRE